LAGGNVVTAHVANTGSMMGLTVDAALSLVDDGTIVDAKTVLLLHHLRLGRTSAVEATSAAWTS
jgi:hypothetical protein